jgi:spore coat protein U-like protein
MISAAEGWPLDTQPIDEGSAGKRDEHSMKSFVSILGLCVLVISLASAPVHAATASVSFNVSATVLSSCAASASPTVFGTAQAAAPAVSVQCSHPTAYNVEVKAGGGSATVANRVVGAGRAGDVDSTAAASTNAVQTIPALRPISLEQYVEGDLYKDAVVVTVTY